MIPTQSRSSKLTTDDYRGLGNLSSRQNILKSLISDTSPSKTPKIVRELVELINIVDHPEALPPSKQYSNYSGRIGSRMSAIDNKEEARQFVLNSYILSLDASVPPVVIYHPTLREFVKHFHKDPELLVVLFDYSDTVGEVDVAGEWLRNAHELEADNWYVLWQRIVARGNPWYPSDLINDSDVYEDEKWLLKRLLEKNATDPIALGVESYLNNTKRSLFSTLSVQFLNSLLRVYPHPMRQVGLPSLLDPRRLARSSKLDS